MPLDGHSYLTSYGWSGKGTGLRKGAIDRPLAIPPKKNLAGLGKDRDEAFPFWDHLFTAASKSITIKVTSDDDDDSGLDTSVSLNVKRTATGIISNRRPVAGTPASGIATPDSDATPRLSLIATAKREAAKQGLYSRFFRGPVLGPDDNSDITPTPSPPFTGLVGETIHIVADENTKINHDLNDHVETKTERRERKRLKSEAKEAKRNAKAEKRKRKDEQQAGGHHKKRKKLKNEMKKIHAEIPTNTKHTNIEKSEDESMKDEPHSSPSSADHESLTKSFKVIAEHPGIDREDKKSKEENRAKKRKGERKYEKSKS
ncbi:hypothetical protein BJ138DRAFT_886598 [Hygrophoropsis aurantiaca]|uniref:Uncharacterized protein n=1 Tax=Hygrophoropsis aurantiaca TaxID=72124 RepID=A0ACB8AEZ0_9AGAM|nr:hypothetical protein BJ138DRAFT_886598 [Hygrophoropsis aurantiaca]